MFKHAVKMVVLAVVVLLLSIDNSEAAGRTYLLYQGQTVSFPIDPGETVTVVCVSNGRPYTFTWWSSLSYWLTFPNNNKPFTAFTAYVDTNASCRWLRNAAVQPTRQNSAWSFRAGWYYVFMIKNYSNGDWVSLQVR